MSQKGNKKEDESVWKEIWAWTKLIGMIGGIVLLFIGAIFTAFIIGGAVKAQREAIQNMPAPVTLLREGTVEEIEFFQHGVLNESRTFINFTDARSLIIGGYQPLEVGVGYQIWYNESPYQHDVEVPTDAHVTLVHYDEA